MIVAVIVAGVLLSIGVPRFAAIARAVPRRRGGSQPAGDLVGPAALLVAEPDLCHRSEHARLRQSDRPLAPGGDRSPTAIRSLMRAIAGSRRRRPAAAPRAGAAASRSPPMALSPEPCSNQARVFPWSRDSSENQTEPLAMPVPLSRTRHSRGGYSLLEVQVAFAILGIGLAGLCPLVVMQLRQVRQLELRLQGHVVQTSFLTGQSQTMLQGNKYYIVPWTNPWAQKLSGSGQILTSPTNSCDPGIVAPAHSRLRSLSRSPSSSSTPPRPARASPPTSTSRRLDPFREEEPARCAP